MTRTASFSPISQIALGTFLGHMYTYVLRANTHNYVLFLLRIYVRGEVRERDTLHFPLGNEERKNHS